MLSLEQVCLKCPLPACDESDPACGYTQMLARRRLQQAEKRERQRREHEQFKLDILAILMRLKKSRYDRARYLARKKAKMMEDEKQ